MAIGFVKSRYVSRSKGGSACNSSAYNARTKIVDQRTGEVFDYSKRKDNVYHEMLLPEYVDKKFKNPVILANEVEANEHQKNSQVYIEWVLALPKEKEVTLEMKTEIINRFIKYKNWIEEGVGVQIDIHKPHEKGDNWHAHLLVTTRRFTKDGLGLERLKARDLQPKVVNGAVVEETKDTIAYTDIQNNYFKECGLDLKVDLPGELTQEHIGPVRMRSVLNQAANRNEEKRLANIETLSSGKALLDMVTNHMSVFNKDDLIRAVKSIPDQARAHQLVEEALSDKSLLELFDEGSTNTRYYTTNEVREDELKLVRLSGYVTQQSNRLSTSPLKATDPLEDTKDVNCLIDKAKDSLTEEQHAALSHLLLSNSGIRIMRGRAGTGKSHVLGKIVSISEALGVNVIGLSPTHKAKQELVKCGYTQVDTIKGMLFKLYNDRFELPKNSLLVVDEAAMVGNDDYRELLRVASGRKCNVILAGDERQLSSVQRGGMFEIFADYYGSASLLEIKRQDSNWGKSVAMALSNGEVRTGISILQERNRIISSDDKTSSMEALLLDWDKSEQPLANKLIISVKNTDIFVLNHGARECLKASGYLQGKEIAIGANHYMKDDRILIKQTNKDLGFVNGDLLEITHVSKEQFTVKDNLGKETSFDPSKFNDFRHGYATTVFKSQGVSINDVFVLHGGFSTIRNSYVALSRNIKELKLYTNNESTRDTAHLIKQLSFNPDTGSSLQYSTKRDLEKNKLKSDFDTKKGVFASLVVGAMEYGLKKITEFSDKNLALTEYYHYEAPELKKEKVEEVLNNVGYELSSETTAEEGREQNQMRAVVGGNVIMTSSSSNNLKDSATPATNPLQSADLQALATKVELKSNFASASKPALQQDSAQDSAAITSTNKNLKASAKDRFYAKADYMRNISRGLQQKENWDKESEQLRSEIRFKSEQIVRNLLGEPNGKLSDGRTLRYGKQGKLAVRITGESSGAWYDFSAEKGGDMFALVQDKKNCDFKSAADYLRQSVGMEVGSSNYLQLVHDHRNSDLTIKYLKDKQKEDSLKEQKQAQLAKLIDRAKDITETSVAFKYLTQHRSISCNLGNDIKTTGIYVKEKNGYLPALIAYARDSQGNITGGQQVVLNKNGSKAKIDVPKRSFGRIAGSFVDLGNISHNNQSQVDVDITDKITIIAEGIETGLSVKQGLSNDSNYPNYPNGSIKVLCSLGISNISNYKPSKGEKIIIAADNDGDSAITNKTIDSAKIALEKEGAFVEIVRPNREGDFNDTLIAGNKHEIKDTFSVALAKHRATSLNQYLIAGNKTQSAIKFNDQEKQNLIYIQKYDLSEKLIVEAYRKSNISGAIELEETRKSLEFANFCYKQNKEILFEAEQWGYKGTEIDSTKSMLGMDEITAIAFCTEIREDYLEKYLDENVTEFRGQKARTFDIEKLKPIIIAEQKFLKKTYESLKSPISGKPSNVVNILRAGEVASKHPEILSKIFILADKLTTEYAYSEITICQDMRASVNSSHIYTKLDKNIELQHVNSTIAKLDTQVSVATSSYEVIKALDNKQKFCATIYPNLKYPEGQDYLEELTKVAKAFQLEKIPEKLQGIVATSIKLGARSESSLIKELQTTENSRNTYRKLAGELEVFHINSTLDSLAKEKQESPNPQKTIEILGKQDSFLAGLNNNLNYPDIHNEGLFKSIQNAHKNERDNIVHHLHQIVTLHMNQVGTKDSEIGKILKSSEDTRAAFNSLDQSYKSHVIDEVQKSLQVIASGKTVGIDNKNFNSPVKFLDHVMKTRSHEYFPSKEVQKMQTKAVDHQKQLIKDIGSPRL